MELHYKKGTSTTTGDDKLMVSYLGGLLLNIHTNFLNLAFDCASAYYLTGNTDYAQLAADIISSYTEGLSQMNMSSHNYGGLLLTESYIVEARYTHVLPLAYDLIKSYISAPGVTVFDPITKGRKPFDEAAVQKYFVNQVNCTLNSGLGDNNWAVMESPVAWYSLMNVTDETTRNALFNKMYVTGVEKRQDPLPELIDGNVNEQGAWAESFTYSSNQVMRVLMFIESVDREWPELNLLDNYMHLVDGCNFFQNFYYPNGEHARFGDSHRGDAVDGVFDYAGYEDQYELIYRLADNNPDNAHLQDVKQQMGNHLKYYYGENNERSHTWENGGFYYDTPLKLFWGYDFDQYNAEPFVPSTTKIAKRQGLVVQRNLFGANAKQNGLMCYSGGASYVHSDCSGLDLELYGLGEVLGTSGGEDKVRSSSFHDDYLKEYPGHNSVTVNGISKGIGGWGGSGMPTTQTLALEPLMDEAPISENFTFSQQLIDDVTQKYDQQRTVSIIRTSPTTGYYFDMFRSKGDGLVDKFHDYLYHNIGDEMKLMDADGVDLSTTATNSRFSQFLNKAGWGFIEDIHTTATLNEPVKVRFAMTKEGKYMHALMPKTADMEYSKALTPATIDAPSGYDKTKTPLLIIRKNGEAWNNPFVVAYEPSMNTEPSIQSVENMVVNNKVLGTIVKSVVNGKAIYDYILAMDKPDSVAFSGVGIVFNGRFAIVRKEFIGNAEKVTLYIGDGNELTYGDSTLVANSKNQGLKVYEQDITPFYALNLSAENGSCTATPDLAEYIEGSQVSIIPTPKEGYTFSHWSGAVSSSENPLTITFNSNMSLVAHFEEASALNELNRIDVIISPNPSDGVFNIKVDNGDESNYEVFDSRGVKVQTGRFVGRETLTIDSAGIYFIKVSSSKGYVLRKLVVM